MTEFLSWRLKDMPFYKDQQFDLSRKGISLIRGLNLDSGNENQNGAGKSLFFSELAELISSKPMIGERQDTVRQGVRELEFRRGKATYKVVRSFSKKGKESLEIERNGKPLDFHGLPAAKDKLKELLPYSEQEVQSLFYIDARIPHPLVRGSSASRQEFFRRFFKMSSSSAIRKLIAAELDEIKRAEGVAEELRRRIKDLKREELADPEVLKARLDKLRSKESKLESQTSRFRKIQSVAEAYRESKPALAALKEMGITSAEEAREARARVEEKIKIVNSKLRAWSRFKELKAETEEARSELGKLSKDIGGYPGEYESEKETTQFKLDYLKTKREAIQHKLGVLRTSMERDEEEIRSLNRKISNAEEQIKELSKTANECPTCGQAWSNKHAKKEIENAQTRLDRNAVALHRLKRTLRIQKTELKEYEEKYETVSVKYEETLLRLKKLTAYLSIVVPKAAEPPDEDVKSLKTKAVRLEEKSESLAVSSAHLPNKIAYDALSSEDRDLLKGDDPTDLFIDIQQKIAEIAVRLDDSKSKVKELAVARSRLAEIKGKTSEREALELLYQAFSSKGVDTIRIRTITDRLTQLVNRFAQLVFPEDYKFSFELETQFNFLVTRKYGKKVVVSDVRKLSGAESLIFNLVLYLALLALVPAALRPSLLILDEPTAALSEEMTASFLKLLPIMQTAVSHIVVITPQPLSVDYPNAKTFTVVKKGGQSTIREGVIKA